MSSPKIINNIQYFEKSIANAIYGLLIMTFLITTILFGIIYYQTKEKHNSEKFKEIDTAISVFRSNLSEKLSIIANSNVFINFLTSGSATRNELEPLLLSDLLPLKTNGMTGFLLTNTETGGNYQSGSATNKSVTLKLCYLAKKT